MKTCQVERVICRKAHNTAERYKKHGVFVVIKDNNREFAMPFPVWELLGWKAWTGKRLNAVRMTAPAQVAVWFTWRNGGWWASLPKHEARRWAVRVAEYLDQPAPEKTPVVNKPVVPASNQFVCMSPGLAEVITICFNSPAEAQI